MSTGHVIPCGCCTADMSEDNIYVDPDLNTPVCPACKVNLNWAAATLRRRTPAPTVVSIYGMHREGEKAIHWDPSIADREYQKWLDSQEGPQS